MSKTTNYKLKASGDDWAQFTVRERGTDEMPELTVEIESGYREAFVAELKDELPYGARAWDKASKVWRVLPRFQELAQRIACRHYASVWLVEGTEIKDLKSGVTQQGLF